MVNSLASIGHDHHDVYASCNFQLSGIGILLKSICFVRTSPCVGPSFPEVSRTQKAFCGSSRRINPGKVTPGMEDGVGERVAQAHGPTLTPSF